MIVIGIAIAITLILEKAKCTSVSSSMIIGMLSGLLASIIAAWLLDISNCKRKNIALKKRVDADLSYLKTCLDDLFQEIRNNIPSADDREGMQFKVLFEKYVESRREYQNEDASSDSYVGIYVFTNEIVSVIDKLTTGEENDYLFRQDSSLSQFLSLRTSIAELRDNLFNNGEARYKFIGIRIHDFLSTLILYGDLLDKEYFNTMSLD